MNCSRQHCEYEPECAYRRQGAEMDIVDGDCPFYETVEGRDKTFRETYFRGVYEMFVVSMKGFRRRD